MFRETFKAGGFDLLRENPHELMGREMFIRK